MRRIIKIVIMRLFQLMPIRRNRVVCTSYYGKFYNDNPKAISDELKGQGFELFWLVNDKSLFYDRDVTFVNTHSLYAVYLLATAAVWIDNCRKGDWVRKKEGQIYIQTWHGSLALKRIEKDAESKLLKQYRNDAINDGKMTDFMVSNSQWCTDLFKRAFWFNGNVITCGSPRLDKLINGQLDKKRSQILNSIGVSDKTKILLYAPTFRSNHSIDIYNIDYKQLIDCLMSRTGCKWTILLRLHPNICEKGESIKSDDVIDVSKYDDIYELMSICDFFVTDYSSTMFEAALVRKKVVLFTSDYEEYVKERNFYFDMKELPFPIVFKTEELIDTIENYNSFKYENAIADFFEKLGVVESGTSAKAVVDVIKANCHR